jgi:hypothetical protein
MPFVYREPGLCAFLNDGQVFSNFSFTDDPWIRLAGLPRFGPIEPRQRIVVFGVVSDDHVGTRPFLKRLAFEM